jgi:DNA (cytosine-5)-methyltransferase 1
MPLHYLKTKHQRNALLFDGIASYGSFQAYLKAVPFDILSIGYDASNHTVSNVWLQSSVAGRRDSWYALGESSPEYRGYHSAFLWNANFCKYFMDYLLEYPAATVQDFRHKFCASIAEKHAGSSDFSSWRKAYGKSDFRVPLTSCYEFLWKEASDVEPKLQSHPIWKEFDSKQLRAIPRQMPSSKMTIVTPFVYNCFKDLYFASVLESRPWTTPSVISNRRIRLKNLGFPTHEFFCSEAPADAQELPKSVAAGDVVAICRDTRSAWKDMSKKWFGMGYVQRHCASWLTVIKSMSTKLSSGRTETTCWKSSGCTALSTRPVETCIIRIRTRYSCLTTAPVAKPTSD